ncbi:MAG: acylphosphatase [Candidatus Bathyarchaeia archaeon]
MRAYSLRIYGRVQGVGYRRYLLQLAWDLGLAMYSLSEAIPIASIAYLNPFFKGCTLNRGCGWRGGPLKLIDSCMFLCIQSDNVLVGGVSEKGKDELGVEPSLSEVVSRVEELEREMERLNALIPIRSMTSKPVRVSLRGMARVLVSMDELERSIEESKDAPFRYEL